MNCSGLFDLKSTVKSLLPPVGIVYKEENIFVPRCISAVRRPNSIVHIKNGLLIIEVAV